MEISIVICIKAWLRCEILYEELSEEEVVLLCLWVKSFHTTRVCPQRTETWALKIWLSPYFFRICYVLAPTSWYFIYITFIYLKLWFYDLNYVGWIVEKHFNFFTKWNKVNNSTFILHMHGVSYNRFIGHYFQILR